MFHFPAFALHAPMDSARNDSDYRMPGFLIRTSPDQSLLGGSPELFAASHVLHRLLDAKASTVCP